MTHAMILGYVGLVLGVVGVVTTWNLGLGPRWYPIGLALHMQNGAIFGAAYANVARLLPLTPTARGPVR